MAYTLRLKIYTNESLKEGTVVVPEEPVSGGPAPLLHCHPNDYLQILRIIATYYKGKANEQAKKEEGKEAQVSSD